MGATVWQKMYPTAVSAALSTDLSVSHTGRWVVAQRIGLLFPPDHYGGCKAYDAEARTSLFLLQLLGEYYEDRDLRPDDRRAIATTFLSGASGFPGGFLIERPADPC